MEFQYNLLPILETKRLTLRPVVPDDVLAIYHYAKDPEVSRLLDWYPPKSIEETSAIVHQWIENYGQNKQAPWAIVYKEDDIVIGTIDVRYHKHEDLRVYLGYCLSREYWGKGLMVEALKAVLTYLFTQTSTVEVYALVRTDNMQSQRVLEKVGFFRDEPEVRRTLMKGQSVVLDRWSVKRLYFLHKMEA